MPPLLDIPVGWATVLSAIFGGLVTGLPMLFTQWRQAKQAAREKQDTDTKLDEINAALSGSAAFKEIKDKLAQDFLRFEKADKEHVSFAASDSQLQRSLDEQQEVLRSIKLTLLRQDLFAHTCSRAEHEHQIESGTEYLNLRGNGIGHVRLNQLQKDYERRLAENDWNYGGTK